MYLKGSRLSMTRRRRAANPLKILLLMVLVAGALYVNFVIVPTTPPLFVATSTPTRSPQSFVTDAEALAAQGKTQQAILAYKNAILSEPRNAANFVALARLQVLAGQYTEAIGNAENATLINTSNSSAQAVRGWALGFTGDWLAAEATLNKAIELDAKNAVAYAYYAEMMALQYQDDPNKLGVVQKAIAASKTAQTLAPNTLETHRARGIVLEMTSNYSEAAKEFEAAIAINPNIADLHLALGRNYRTLELYDKAITEFGLAIPLNPTDPLPKTYISRTYQTVGQYAKAIQYAQQALKDSPADPLLHGNLGLMYYSNRQYPNAVEPLRLAVRGGTTAEGVTVKGLPLDYGRVAEYYARFGLALAKTNQCAEAIETSQMLLKTVPDDEDNVFNAREMVKICENILAGTPAAGPTGTPGAPTRLPIAPTNTPQPTK